MSKISLDLNRLHQRLNKSLIIRHIGYLHPFSPFRGIIWGMFDKSSQSVLDVGCWRGGAARLLRMHGFSSLIIGVDLYLPYLKALKRGSLYNDLILCDVRSLPFKEKVIDVVLAIDVIEHLRKSEGYKLIQNIEEIAKKQVILSTPRGFMKMFHKDLGMIETHLQEHRSGWMPQEFEKMGYRVKGNFGPSFLPRDIAYWLSFVLPLTYFVPKIAYHIACVKYESSLNC